MAVVTNTGHKVYIPHEQSEADGGPHWVEIRNLSGSEMDEAQQVKSIRILEQMGHLWGELRHHAPKSDKATKDSLEVRRHSYDHDVLIKHAPLACSYGELPEQPGHVLDAITRDWLWDTIVDENTRSPLPSPSGEPSQNWASSLRNSGTCRT